MRVAFLAAVVLSGCTLVVGSDPNIDDAEASTPDDASAGDGDAKPKKSEDASTVDVAQVTDTGTPPKTCDAGGCNATKNACKTACANTGKACNDMCDDNKSCHDLCAVQQASCNNACVQSCDQCVMGCGPPCSN